MENCLQQDAVGALGERRRYEDTFEAFVKKHMKEAYYIALGLVGNHCDALDLSQEAFCQAYRHRKKLRDQSKMFPWYYRILRNLCFRHLKKQKNRKAASFEEAHAENRVETSLNDRFEFEVIEEKNELTKRVWSAIGRLSDKHREVIILRHFRNLSYEQIAAMLFCSKGTVTSRLYHARKQLQELLKSEKGGRCL